MKHYTIGHYTSALSTLYNRISGHQNAQHKAHSRWNGGAISSECNTVMGILTDNRGGRLVVEDSLIENTGLNDRSSTLGHGLYAGGIDSLIMRRSTIRAVNSAGHTLKSRALETILE